jgi:sulfofructose kinase
MIHKGTSVDVLCVGTAAYDLTFQVPHHPGVDEKMVASSLVGCGGGPAANAAVAVARLGFSSAFAGYLGEDFWGQENLRELDGEGVITDLIVRGPSPTPLSIIMVKPDGCRTVVNYNGRDAYLAAESVDHALIEPKVILFDGHEPLISLPLAQRAREVGIPTILDAGSVHRGTVELEDLVDDALGSQGFALDFTGKKDEESAVRELVRHAPVAVVTLGDRGLIWATREQGGTFPAFPVKAVDTTGAGDAFHGAFATYIAAGLEWQIALHKANAAAALSCTRVGARRSLPTKIGLDEFLRSHDDRSA